MGPDCLRSFTSDFELLRGVTDQIILRLLRFTVLDIYLVTVHSLDIAS